MNDNVDPRTGVHRVRKKKGSKASQARSDDVDVDYHPPEVPFDAAAFDQQRVVAAAAGIDPTAAPPTVYPPQPMLPQCVYVLLCCLKIVLISCQVQCSTRSETKPLSTLE